MMSDPIRVAQVMGYMNGGGVEQVVMNYYRHIDRSKVQFDLIVCEGSTMIPRKEVESLGGRVLMVPPYSDVLGYQRALIRLFEREGWGIVHSHMNALSVFPLRAAKRVGIPVRIAHSHSTSGRGEYAKNAIKTLLKSQANRYPTHRFACSIAAGEWLFGRDSDFTVVHNAIEVDKFTFDADARESIRCALGVGEGQFAVLHVGRFMAQKNHPFLIEAFSNLVELQPDSVLLLVGSGPGVQDAKDRVRSLGITDKVQFLGQRSDVERLYSAADAFALPSLYEGLGIVAVEAQVSGLPCFLSDEVTREVDVTGTCRFLPIENSRIWSRKLADVDVGRRLGTEASSFSRYDIAQASSLLEKAYERLTKT